MRKIEKTNEKSNRTLGYALLGVGAAALVGAVTALVVKSKREDERFRECLADALNEGFESVASNENAPLRVIVIGSNGDEECDCGCDRDCCCCCCENACDCDYCDCCDCSECKCDHVCENAYHSECDCDASGAAEPICDKDEPAHDTECSCEECKATKSPTEEPEPEIKLEKPVRKSKKQPE